MRPHLTTLLAVTLAACATPPVAKQAFPMPEAAAPQAGAAAPGAGPRYTDAAVETARANPTRYASSFPRAEFCEEEARRLRHFSPEVGWSVLKACLVQGRFTLLSRLLGGPWEKDLQTRPEASLLLARVVAARGGDLEGDLAAMRRQRISIFPVSAALNHADLYKGRLVLFRAVVRDVKMEKGKGATARLAEYGIMGTSTYVDSEERSVSRDSGSATYTNNRGYQSNIKGAGETQHLTQRRLTGNDLTETGLEIIGRLAEVDPFFEPERQFIVLGRFDGVRDVPAPDPDDARRLALVSVVAYFEPSVNVIE